MFDISVVLGIRVVLVVSGMLFFGLLWATNDIYTNTFIQRNLSKAQDLNLVEGKSRGYECEFKLNLHTGFIKKRKIIRE